MTLILPLLETIIILYAMVNLFVKIFIVSLLYNLL